MLNINFSKNGGAKKIILKGVSNNQFAHFRYSQDTNECRLDVVLNAPKNNSIPNIMDLFNSLQKDKVNGLPYKVNDIEAMDVAFKLKVNDEVKTFSLANITNLGMNLNITEYIQFGVNGYPTYSSMNQEAYKFISYIRAGNNNEKTK